MNFAFGVEGRAPVTSGEPMSADYRAVTPSYFRAMGIPILRGRGFTERDEASGAPVIIVNETLARNYFPGEDPIGRRVSLGINNFTGDIVGVVGDVKHTGLASEVHEEAYGPYAQTPYWHSMTLVVRGATDPAALASAVRSAVAVIDGQQPLGTVRTLDQVLSESMAAPRFRTILLGLFAAAALVLAAIGIYGVISYSVSQRRHEIGVRMALGARPADMLKLVVRQAMVLASIGVAVGTLAAYAATRVLSSLLFEVSPTDPGTFAGVAVVLASAAFVASLVPAVRATRVDPLIALRTD
jgi:putative ABC transport system permease protein